MVSISVKPCAITHDIWTSLNNESNETDSQFHYRYRATGMQSARNHRPKVITRLKLSPTSLDRFKSTGTSVELVSVTDNTSNKVKVFKLLDWRRISCMGHNINLWCQWDQSNGGYSFCHQSPQAIDDLMGEKEAPSWWGNSEAQADRWLSDLVE